MLLISHLLLGEKTVRASAPKILNSLGEFGGNPWDALRASRILASKKPMSSLMVPGVGIEPTSLARHDFKSCAYTNSATRAFFCLEAWGGIEPPYIPFAEECLTTWLPGHSYNLTLFIKLSKYS